MTTLQQQNVLLFSRTMGLGGTENVVLQLCEILNPVVNKVVVCSCGGVNEKQLDEMGITHYTIPDIENKHFKNILLILKTVRNIIDKEQITIIHVHHRMAAFYVTLLKKCDKRLTFFATAHNTFNDKKWLTRFAYDKATIIACGKDVKDNLINYYHIQHDRIAVISNSVKAYEKAIVPDKQLERLKKEGFILVGNIGRLSEQKGMRYFVDSFKLAHDKVNNLKYIIVGQGEDEQSLKERVKNNKSENDIIFLGYRTDIQNIIGQIDFVVLSSLWEGLPLTPIEAFSMHKPVIGTAVDGTKEIIEDKINGFLITPKDPLAIAEKVVELAINKEECLMMGENAYLTYKKRFGFDIFEKNILNFYRNNV